MSIACLLDTNVLLHLANPAAPEHASAKAAVARLLVGDERPVIAAQAPLRVLERGHATGRGERFGLVHRAGPRGSRDYPPSFQPRKWGNWLLSPVSPPGFVFIEFRAVTVKC
jgi:hypothetical protein